MTTLLTLDPTRPVPSTNFFFLPPTKLKSTVHIQANQDSGKEEERGLEWRRAFGGLYFFRWGFNKGLGRRSSRGVGRKKEGKDGTKKKILQRMESREIYRSWQRQGGVSGKKNQFMRADGQSRELGKKRRDRSRMTEIGQARGGEN